MDVPEGTGPKPGRYAFEKDRDLTFRQLICNVSGYMKPGEEPGKVFNYQTFGMNILCHAIATAYGMYDSRDPQPFARFRAPDRRENSQSHRRDVDVAIHELRSAAGSADQHLRELQPAADDGAGYGARRLVVVQRGALGRPADRSGGLDAPDRQGCAGHPRTCSRNRSGYMVTASGRTKRACCGRTCRAIRMPRRGRAVITSGCARASIWSWFRVRACTKNSRRTMPGLLGLVVKRSLELRGR